MGMIISDVLGVLLYLNYSEKRFKLFNFKQGSSIAELLYLQRMTFSDYLVLYNVNLYVRIMTSLNMSKLLAIDFAYRLLGVVNVWDIRSD